MTVALASVLEPYASALVDGTKIAELRRRAWRLPVGTKLLIYAARSTMAVIGHVMISGPTNSLPPADLWAFYAPHAARKLGIERRVYDQYFKGSATAHAIQVDDAVRYEDPYPLTEIRAARSMDTGSTLVGSRHSPMKWRG